ncbi:outer membrane protein assembly factor BamE [Chitinimonas sp. PSY-7]|uniref:outer membrane protein assembly factor BamE domain-containing protein n=1 Tax=Chitinimonas sp. PSY-7 TaxID=3459088 RepID=UPI00403FD445
MRTLLIAFLLAGLSACSYLTPYKLEVPQGNAVTADQVAKLKIGMSRSQVRFALGTPMLADAFHPDRWDYLYYESTGSKVAQNKRYYVQFEGDRLISMGGETLPARAVITGQAPANPREQAK